MKKQIGLFCCNSVSNRVVVSSIAGKTVNAAIAQKNDGETDVPGVVSITD